jgi:hypothetical protein
MRDLLFDRRLLLETNRQLPVAIEAFAIGQSASLHQGLS